MIINNHDHHAIIVTSRVGLVTDLEVKEPSEPGPNKFKGHLMMASEARNSFF